MKKKWHKCPSNIHRRGKAECQEKRVSGVMVSEPLLEEYHLYRSGKTKEVFGQAENQCSEECRQFRGMHIT